MFINLCKLPEYTGERIKLDSFDDLEEAFKAARGYVDAAQDLNEDIELIIDFHYERKEKNSHD